MPSYGPWQEGRIHESIVYAKTSVDEDDEAREVLLSPEPTLHSGWAITGSSDGWGSSAVVGDNPEGGLDDPPPPEPAFSLAAFTEMMNQPVATGFEMQYKITKFGGRLPIGPGLWSRQHGWSSDGNYYRMTYSGIEWVSGADVVVPLGFPVSTDEYYVEIEPWVNGEEISLTLVEAQVLSMPPAADYDLFVKNAGVVGGFLRNGEFSGLSPSSIESAKSTGTPVMGGAPLDVEQMQILQDEVDNLPDHAFPGLPNNSWEPRFPNFAVLYTGPYRNDTTWNTEVVDTFTAGRVAVQLRYQMPRWRQVFRDQLEGRYKVNVGTDNAPQWKYLIPRAGENGGLGVGKVNIGTEANPTWQRLDRRLKVSDNGTFLQEPPVI